MDQDHERAQNLAQSTNDLYEPREETRRGSSVKLAEANEITILIKIWLNRALLFISNADNETLGACLVGLAACTYLILGRIGLLLIGLVIGVVLHATWEHIALSENEKAGDHGMNGTSDKIIRRREVGLDVVRRVWRWRDERKTDNLISSVNVESEEADEDSIQIKLLTGKQLDYSSFKPNTAKALTLISDTVIRNYVQSWYSPLTADDDIFPASCRQTLVALIISLSSHISKKRPAEMFLNVSINSSSIFVAFLSELSAVAQASSDTDMTTALHSYLKDHPDSSLAMMTDGKAQRRKLSVIAEDILQNHLDVKGYNFNPVHSLLHAIISKVILEKVLESCSQPEFLNKWIVHFLEGRKMAQNNTTRGAADNGSEDAFKDLMNGFDESQAQNLTRERQYSKAEEAMEQALEEAKRLTNLIAEEEAAKGARNGMPSDRDAESSSHDSLKNTTAILHDQDELDIGEAHNKTKDQPGEYSSYTDHQPSRESKSSLEMERHSFTLYNSKLSIFDDTLPNEKSTLKTKPTTDYLIQIEPADSSFAGWMIARKFTDFETLHEILRRISVITGETFTDIHANLPNWKHSTKANLRAELEKYLNDAIKYQSLAESEGMKRFFEKDTGSFKSASNKGIAWVDPLQVGKGMIDVLAKANNQVAKEVAGGSKAFVGGITSVLGVKKTNSSQNQTSSIRPQSTYNSDSTTPSKKSTEMSRNMEHQSGVISGYETLTNSHDNNKQSRAFEINGPLPRASTDFSISNPDQSDGNDIDSRLSVDTHRSQPRSEPDLTKPLPSIVETNTPTDAPLHRSNSIFSPQSDHHTSEIASVQKGDTNKAKSQPMTEQEVHVTVDLLFAIISELYTLSSAWTFRRTLLQAARTFLLRPGNPQLEAVRVLIQNSVIDNHASDIGIANVINKIRTNVLVTRVEAEKIRSLNNGQGPGMIMSDEAKEKLRIKARALLIEKGMPQALTSVMGTVATGEALGKVFDCLQVQKVARGLVFGLVLQALRATLQ